MDNGRIIASVPYPSAHPAVEDEIAANKRLIAAAPELLAACEDALVLIRNSGFRSGLVESEFDRVLHALGETIAKAKGVA